MDTPVVSNMEMQDGNIDLLCAQPVGFSQTQQVSRTWITDQNPNANHVNMETLCKLIVNYFILEKIKEWEICLYHVEFEPLESRKEVSKLMLKEVSDDIKTPYLFDGRHLVLMYKLPTPVTRFFCKNAATKEMTLIKITIMREFSSLKARFLHIFNMLSMMLRKVKGASHLELSKSNHIPKLDIAGDNCWNFNSHSLTKEPPLTNELSRVSSAWHDDLKLFDLEAETWVETVDKEIVAQLEEIQRKKQEAIYELIKTEKRHCRMLVILKEDFAKVMLKQLGVKESSVEKIFPHLDHMINLHCSFLWFLREEQRYSKLINNLGDLLCDQFTGHNGTSFKAVYSESYSKRKEAIATYRNLEKSDRRFQEFISKTSNHPLMNKKGIPEATLFLTHRVTQYPLLIDKIIKYTEISNPDHQKLKHAQECAEGILIHINSKVAQEENNQKLIDIHTKVDSKSSTMYNGHKFDKSDLIRGRILKFEGKANLSLASNSLPGNSAIPVVVVVLSDVICLLHEASQKYYFLSLDGEYGVLPIHELEVFEKPHSDNNSISVLHRGECIFEFECVYPKERKRWIESLRYEGIHREENSTQSSPISLFQMRALSDLEKKISRERYQIRREREHLRKEKMALRLEQEDIQQQRDDLFRKSEALKNQGILLPSTLPPPMPTTPGAISSGPNSRSSPSLASPSAVGSAASLPRMKKQRNSTATLKREASIKPAVAPKQVLPMKLAKLGTG